MISELEKYCTQLLSAGKCAQLPFHNIEHTKEVVSNVKVICNYQRLSKEEIEPIVIAAWFHDTGHLELYQGHEEVSKRLAKEFLEKQGYPQAKLETVLACIEATKMPQNCTSKYAAVLCDADIFHIGTPDFFFKKLLLRREWDLKDIMKVSDIEWHKLNLKFLHDHHFRTAYGKEILERGKLENEEKVKYILGFCE
ncbi:HD domain-containing protein [Maribacter sp. 2307ULW6-5]|uniref:HD domain-containing protein n=1 Tax=Maribacter sp. 2307ULW6-5 TaxID=3386275 RepID=UPI0039BD0EE1